MAQYPGAEWDRFPKYPGGLYILGYPFKFIVHRTQVAGSYSPRVGGYAGTYFGHAGNPEGASPPHFTISEDGELWQHIDTDFSSYALENHPGGVETNRLCCIQVELMGFSEENTLGLPQIESLRGLVQWASRTHGFPLQCLEFHQYPPEGAILLNGREPWRLSFENWMTFSGVCGHQHIPENVHGDPGWLDPSWLGLELVTPPTSGSSWTKSGPATPLSPSGAEMTVHRWENVGAWTGGPLQGRVPVCIFDPAEQIVKCVNGASFLSVQAHNDLGVSWFVCEELGLGEILGVTTTGTLADPSVTLVAADYGTFEYAVHFEQP